MRTLRITSKRLSLLHAALTAAILFFPVARGTAADRYVRAGAAGTGSGTNWTDAYTALPAALVRGDVYYIADGTYGAYTFDDAASGAQLITIRKATIADHGTDTGWDDSYGDGQAVFSSPNTIWSVTSNFWLFDGQYGSGEGVYGFKLDFTGTGDSVRALNIDGSSITVRYVDVEGNGHAGIAADYNQDGIYVVGGAYSSIVLAHNYIHDWKRCGIILASGVHDIVVEHNVIARTYSTAEAHGQGIQVGANGDSNYNIDFRYNTFVNIEGSGFIFFLGGASSVHHDMNIYGNVFYSNDPSNWGTATVIGTNNDTTCDNCNVYNNTFFGLTGRGSSGALELDHGYGIASNNIFFNSNTGFIGSWTATHNASDDNYPAQTNFQLLAGDPFVDSAGGDFRLAAPTQNGASLAAPFNADAAGAARGSDGVWDRGAFEFEDSPANTFYIRDGASGVTCADWGANACDSLPANLQRGATYYIADGSYSSYTFDDTASGSQRITIKKATVAEHGTSLGWNASYGDGQAAFGPLSFTTPYWVFDGKSRATPKSGHGFFVDTGPAVTPSNKGIRLNGSGNVTLRYVEIAGHGPDGDGGGNDLIYASVPVSDVTIQYSLLRDAGRTHLLTRGGDNWILEHSVMLRCESMADEHSESWSPGTTSNVTVRYNLYEEIQGTGIIATLDNLVGPDAWHVYGNVFYNSTPSGGVLTTDADSGWTNVRFYNNTIADVTNAGIHVDNGDTTGWQILNNIWYGCTGVNFASDQSVFSHDYNWFYGNTNNAALVASEPNGQAGTGDPFTDYSNGDLTLAVATAGGTVLSSPYNFDPLGAVRGSDGVWDRGAYEFASGASSPGNLRLSASSYSVGENGGDVTITVTRAGGGTGSVGVSYGTSNGTSLAGSDYAVATGTLSWADGDTADKTFTVSITDDVAVEGTETFVVTISNPTGGAGLGAVTTSTVSIIDDEAPPDATSPARPRGLKRTH